MISKRLTILILIVLSVVVTLYIESGRPEVSAEVRARVEAEIMQDSTFPARPVWWDKGHRLGVGVIPDGTSRDSEARRVCALMLKHGITPAEVEVYDVLQIQNDDEWVRIGYGRCE